MSKYKTHYEFDDFTKLFGIKTTIEDCYEMVGDGDYGFFYKEAIENGATEEEALEAMQKAQDEEMNELIKKHIDACERAIESILEDHNLEFENKEGYYIVKPKKGQTWKTAAAKIVETINGYGMFEFKSVYAFLQSGPYTPKEGVMTHLHWCKDRPEVFGDYSAQRIYENAMQ